MLYRKLIQIFIQHKFSCRPFYKFPFLHFDIYSTKPVYVYLLCFIPLKTDLISPRR